MPTVCTVCHTLIFFGETENHRQGFHSHCLEAFQKRLVVAALIILEDLREHALAITDTEG